MRRYRLNFKSRRRWPAILAIIIVAVVAIVFGVRSWYNNNLSPVSSSHKTVYFTVASGSTVHDISVDLKQSNLIRSSEAFETYVRSRELFNKLQAGTYALSPSMSTPQIVSKMVNGEVAKNLLTILPGKSIKQVRQAFAAAGYSSSELDVAFNPSTYADEPILADLPPGASLEGFLYPDSFQKEADTPAQTIVRESLEEMQQHLAPDIVNGFSAQGLNVYQGVTLASIVYKESGNPQYEPMIAQVFLSRLKQGMALGSDASAVYGALHDGVDLPKDADQADDIAIAHDSPYNTRIHTGLPPGPISNMTDDALKAVAHPAGTNYLFFFSSGNCVFHFSQTEAQHEQAIQQYGAKECS